VQSEESLASEVTGGAPLGFLLHLPAEYGREPEKRWPFILFLHGAGERGHRLRAVKREGLPRLLDDRPDFPFIVASPQCPPGQFWTVPPLVALLDWLMQAYAVDADRVYLSGISMGGFGTWGLAAAVPDRFAALAPICGGGDPRQTDALVHIPVWTFHGDRDDIVPVIRTQEMVDALVARGGNVRFTVYTGVGHDSWSRTYANEELYEWFLQHSRKR
jgi:predicted peptidase